MKYKKDLGFAVIKRNQEITPNTIRIFSTSFKLNKQLFGKEPKRFEIILCDTEKEFKKHAKHYYHKWSTATVHTDKKLVTRSPEFVEKIGRWSKKEFRDVIKHEMNHVFWTEFYGTTKPCWLCEGLACFVGNNFILNKKEIRKIIKKYKVDSSILDYRYLKRNFKKGHYPRYPIWANFTNHIVKKYSINKLIRLMNKFIKNPKKDYYKKLFKKTFDKSEKELFSEFLHLINT